MAEHQLSGTALLSDFSGNIIRVLSDELNIIRESNSTGKIQDFCDELHLDENSPVVSEALSTDDQPQSRIFPLKLKTPEPLYEAVAIDTQAQLLILILPLNEDFRDFYWALLNAYTKQPEILKHLLMARGIVEYTNSNADSNAEISESLFIKLSQLNNELNTAQRKLQKSNAELEHLINLKNEMMGMAAHDLRNPLATIMSMSDLLLSGEDDVGSLNETQRNFIEKIHNSSNYMLKLVEGMLEISHIESGKVKIEKEELDLINFTNRVVSLNRLLADKKQVNISTSTDLQQLPMQADTAKLEQVLNNLLSNAIKYSDPGTTVSVHVNYDDDENAAFVSVSDQGPGISEEDQKNLFKPFSRIPNKSNSEKGTGLGLAITQRIISAHHGTISVNSAPDQGSVFSFTLPVSRKEGVDKKTA